MTVVFRTTVTAAALVFLAGCGGGPKIDADPKYKPGFQPNPALKESDQKLPGATPDAAKSDGKVKNEIR